jgi:hypothetical protein
MFRAIRNDQLPSVNDYRLKCFGGAISKIPSMSDERTVKLPSMIEWQTVKSCANNGRR